MVLTLVVFQLLVDACLVSLLFWVWWQTKTKNSAVAISTSTTVPAITAEQLRDLERQIAETRGLVEKRLQEMAELYAKANKLVNSSVFSDGILSDSLEEKEIQEALKVRKETQEIPTLRHLEVTNQRLKLDSTYDLKTLLKGQLT